jgi:hypothetical protein
MPRRFRLLADFAKKSLQPGESTTFTIQMLTDRPLSTNAVLEIRSNADASPFELMLRGNVRPMPFKSPSPIQIVDDGDGNHQLQNQWTRYRGIGAAGDVMFAPAGTGAASSQWTFQVEPGYHRVEATWAAHPNRASNAPFTIRSNGDVLGHVEIDQRLVPQGRVLAGVRWDSLGTFLVDGNSVVVQLSNDADGYVIADAVRLERVAAPVVPDNSTQIVDDRDNGFSTSGAWRNFAGAGRDRDVLFSSQGLGDDIAQWSFIVSPGQYRISTTWAPHPNRASDAPYEVRADGNLLGSKRVNQRGAPTSFRADGSMWQDLGTFAVPGNSLVVQLSNAADGFVIADAVRIEQLS